MIPNQRSFMYKPDTHTILATTKKQLIFKNEKLKLWKIKSIIVQAHRTDKSVKPLAIFSPYFKSLLYMMFQIVKSISSVH